MYLCNSAYYRTSIVVGTLPTEYSRFDFWIWANSSFIADAKFSTRRNVLLDEMFHSASPYHFLTPHLTNITNMEYQNLVKSAINWCSAIRWCDNAMVAPSDFQLPVRRQNQLRTFCFKTICLPKYLAYISSDTRNLLVILLVSPPVLFFSPMANDSNTE